MPPLPLDAPLDAPLGAPLAGLSPLSALLSFYSLGSLGVFNTFFSCYSPDTFGFLSVLGFYSLGLSVFSESGLALMILIFLSI
ncbi:MAG: hypothetical protein ACK52J_05440 [bacterium]